LNKLNRIPYQLLDKDLEQLNACKAFDKFQKNGIDNEEEREKCIEHYLLKVE